MKRSGGLVHIEANKVKAAGGIAEVDEAGRAHFDAGKAQCDFVFVIDTTGSMSDKIDALLATCQRFVEELAKRSIDWRVAVVGFGDLTVKGDTIQATGFSQNVEIVKKSLRSIPKNSGGGNSGESSLEALDRALSLKGYRQSAMKVFIVMTDEPALIGQLTPASITERLRRAEVLTFVISDPEPYFKVMAQATGGEWFQICSGADFLSILDRLIRNVTVTVVDVVRIAGGSVDEYLRLKGSSS